MDEILDRNLLTSVCRVPLHYTQDTFDIAHTRSAAFASQGRQPLPSLIAVALILHNTAPTLVVVRFEGGLHWEILEVPPGLHEFADALLMRLVMVKDLLHCRFGCVGGDFTQQEIAEDVKVMGSRFIGGRGAHVFDIFLIPAGLFFSVLALLGCKHRGWRSWVRDFSPLGILRGV